jgi:hypothetical protein
MSKRLRLQLRMQRRVLERVTALLHILALANALLKRHCSSAVLPLHLRINA